MNYTFYILYILGIKTLKLDPTDWSVSLHFINTIGHSRKSGVQLTD